MVRVWLIMKETTMRRNTSVSRSRCVLLALTPTTEMKCQYGTSSLFLHLTLIINLNNFSWKSLSSSIQANLPKASM